MPNKFSDPNAVIQLRDPAYPPILGSCEVEAVVIDAVLRAMLGEQWACPSHEEHPSFDDYPDDVKNALRVAAEKVVQLIKR